MGSWGVGIFSNDGASDVREGFRDLIAERLVAAQATERLVEEFGIGQDGDEDNDFWLGLAATQHRVGHVVPHVLDRALSIIDSPSELERWEPAQRTRRKAALDNLRDQLLRPPPPPKRLRPRPTVETSLEPHRLPALPNPWPQRADEAMGFILVRERSDPDKIQVLPQIADRRTPTSRWSQAVIKWSELEKWFGPAGHIASSPYHHMTRPNESGEVIAYLTTPHPHTSRDVRHLRTP